MKTIFIYLTIITLCLTGCKVSFSTDVGLGGLKKLRPEMTEYAHATLTEFYNYELELVLNRVDQKVADQFSLELLEQINDYTHETSQPQNAVLFGHNYKTEDGLKYVAIQYNIPNQNGREEVTLSLSYGKDDCCNLIGYHTKIRVGDKYKMDEFEPSTQAE